MSVVVTSAKIGDQCITMLKYWLSMEEQATRAVDPDAKPDPQMLSQAKALAKANDPSALIAHLFTKHEVMFAQEDKSSTLLALFSMLFALVQQAPNTQELTQAAMDAVAVKDGSKPKDRLKVLGELFNSFEPTAPERAAVLRRVITFAIETNQLDMIAPLLQPLRRLCDACGAPTDQYRDLCRIVAAAEASRGNPACALRWTRLAVESYGLDDDASVLAQGSPDAVRAVVGCVKDVACFQYDELAALPAVGALAQSSDADAAAAHALLQLVLTGDVAAVDAFAAQHGAFVTASSIDVDALRSKVRLLLLADMATKTPELSYAAIAGALGVKEDEVEGWVIQAIGADLVEGKLDQVGQQLRVTVAQHRTFAEQDWQRLAQGLEAWETHLTETAQLIEAKGSNQAALQHLVGAGGSA